MVAITEAFVAMPLAFLAAGAPTALLACGAFLALIAAQLAVPDTRRMRAESAPTTG
jgi:hypothetical protein